MIRVNLLSLKRKKKPKALPSFVILGVLLTVVTLIAAGVVYIGLNRKIDSLYTVKKANQAKISELKKKVSEVIDYEAKIKQFKERKKIIVSLRKNQSVPVKVLNELSYVLADGVWLSKMEIKSNDINLDGFAFTNSNIVDFVNNLKRSPMFLNVYLVESKGAKLQDVQVYRFKIKLNIKV
ncbi:fimbrial assembly protein (PilN) [bacterium BMS3Abin07]|nr:fimbrial assembly protein (PilN) [bacterium BMS3Abin07]GBE32847.1 fimbrial assembly protein (PilN) [bacterium BMS3Bbin05]HDO22278.1 hypothetical protein [Nitrospirota bacterium]HDZ88571.1 hypothetical protein [Nitrospirota bacterium]